MGTFDFDSALSHNVEEIQTARNSTLSLLGCRQQEFNPALMGAVFQRVAVELSGQNDTRLKISSDEWHGIFIFRDRVFPALFASEAIPVKPLFVYSVTSPIMKDVGNNMVH